MYEDFYHLSADPFRLAPDARFSFSHRGYTRVREQLRNALADAESLVVVTGRAGSGKTTLIQSLVNELQPGGFMCARLVSSQLDAIDLRRMSAHAFGLRFSDNNEDSLLQHLSEYLGRHLGAGRRPLLIVDEAQNLTASGVQELERLTSLRNHRRLLLQVLLVGQESLSDLLASESAAELRAGCSTVCELTALSADETRDYILHRLQRVGWRDDPQLDDSVMRDLYRFSEGVPRRINVLCGRLLVHGWAEQRHHLTSADVRSVVEELRQERLDTWPTEFNDDGALQPGTARDAQAEADELHRQPPDVPAAEIGDELSRSSASAIFDAVQPGAPGDTHADVTSSPPPAATGVSDIEPSDTPADRDTDALFHLRPASLKQDESALRDEDKPALSELHAAVRDGDLRNRRFRQGFLAVLGTAAAAALLTAGYQWWLPQLRPSTSAATAKHIAVEQLAGRTPQASPMRVVVPSGPAAQGVSSPQPNGAATNNAVASASMAPKPASKSVAITPLPSSQAQSSQAQSSQAQSSQAQSPQAQSPQTQSSQAQSPQTPVPQPQLGPQAPPPAAHVDPSADGANSPSTADGRPAAPPTADTGSADNPAAQVPTLLARARMAMTNYHFTVPAQDSAYSYYRRTLALAPNNPEATRGIHEILRLYAVLARQAADRGHLSRAARYLERGLHIDPDNVTLLALRSELVQRGGRARPHRGQLLPSTELDALLPATGLHR